MTDPDCCANCKFYKDYECHYDPPQQHIEYLENNPIYEYGWPSIDALEWCGKYVRAEKNNKKE